MFFTCRSKVGFDVFLDDVLVGSTKTENLRFIELGKQVFAFVADPAEFDAPGVSSPPGIRLVVTLAMEVKLRLCYHV